MVIMKVTTTELSELFGVTKRSIRAWAKAGMPRLGRGKYDLKETHLWWLDNIYTSKAESSAINDAKTEYWKAKARVERVKADEAEKSVISQADAIEAWAWRVGEMSNGLGGLPLRLAPLIAGKTEIETRKILTDEIWKIRDKFARTGKFTPDTKGVQA